MKHAMKSISRTFRNAGHAVFLALALSQSLAASIVYFYQIDQQVRQTALNFMSCQGFAPHTIPPQMIAEYDQHLEDAIAHAKQQIRNQYNDYVELSKIEEIVREAFGKFSTTLRTLVYSHDLDHKVTQVIHATLVDNGLNPDTIPSDMISEYHQKGQQITSKLRRTMSTDRREYVRMYEIEQEAQKELADLIRKAKNSHSSPWNFFDWLFGHNNSTHNNNTQNHGTQSGHNNNAHHNSPHSNSSTHNNSSLSHNSSSNNNNSNSDDVQRHQLDQKAQSAAHAVLRSNGIDPDKLPARVISNYSDALQKIILRMKNIMSVNSRNVVYAREIESAAREELKPIINQIRYIGEICTICQDHYAPGERIGTLTCGHIYHKDCVYTWLAQQKSCPLCRKNNVIVASQETIL
jgi:hypothetical protein